MQLEQTTVRLAAERFFKSRHPVVLLGVPECSPCAVSPAHWRSPHLRFAGAESLVLRDVEEYLTVVAWLANGDDSRLAAVRPETRAALRRIACYCAEVGSILALRWRDCVHEAHFQQFRDYAGKLVSLAGWEFNLDSASSTLQRRVYRILRTHSRLLAEGESPALDGVNGLLEVRFVPSAYLELIVESVPGEDRLIASVQSANLPGQQITVLPELTQPVLRDTLADYNALENRLDEASSSPDPIEYLRREAASLSDTSITNYAVKEILASLVCPDELGAMVTGDILEHRIRDIRARLWDAPVVAGPVRNRLEAHLLAPAFLRQLDEFPVDVRLDFATLTMPLVKLEAGDEYLVSHSYTSPDVTCRPTAVNSIATGTMSTV